MTWLGSGSCVGSLAYGSLFSVTYNATFDEEDALNHEKIMRNVSHVITKMNRSSAKSIMLRTKHPTCSRCGGRDGGGFVSVRSGTSCPYSPGGLSHSAVNDDHKGAGMRLIRMTSIRINCAGSAMRAEFQTIRRDVEVIFIQLDRSTDGLCCVVRTTTARTWTARPMRMLMVINHLCAHFVDLEQCK